MEIDKPILLIKINDNDEAKFELTEEAEAIILNLKNKMISVICIAGPQRTGKSFLANLLLKKMSGFEVGNSTLPCTKGIWLWGKPIIEEEKATLIIDTEGLNSICNLIS